MRARFESPRVVDECGQFFGTYEVADLTRTRCRELGAVLVDA
jgi:hypothetical protein